ncbi:MAG TPA: Hsp70 family protein [Myxococcales bacterium]
MSEGGSRRPGGPGRKRASLLQLELPCATLDEVRARHPELRSRRFQLRTDEPKPLDTVLVLDARLAGGTRCFRATCVVERVHGGAEPGMTLSLLAADDAGRELVAWMGGAPPPPLKDSAGEAPRAPDTPKAPGSEAQAGAAGTAAQQPDDGSDLVDAFAAFEAAAAAVDRVMEEPAPAQPGRTAPPRPPAPTAAPPRRPPGPAPTTPPPPPPARAPSPPAPAPKRLGAVQLVTRAIPVTPLPPEPALSDLPAGDAPPAFELDPPAAPEPAVVSAPEQELPLAHEPPAAVEPQATLEAYPVPAAEPPALEEAQPAPEETQPAPVMEQPPPTPPARTRSRPPPSRRPAPPPLPRPTLAPGQPAQASAAAAPEIVEDVVPARPAGPRKGPIIGIDLGTTNSCAAVVKDGKAFIIPSREGYNTIPSVVAVSEKGKLLVGHPARGQMLINPKNTVYGAKRLVGRQFNSPVVKDLLGRFAYEVTAGTRGEAAVKLAGQIYSLQKISSLVLGEVKDIAQQWLGCEVGRAVITVPAYYNDNQRQAVRAAGALAGFDVERIVNEPTAAAIAFAHGRKLEQRVLVYDLGGGTFDTSVLELHGNVYEVISTGGDTFLGGVDFDKAVVNELLARFKQKHGVEFQGDRVAYQRIADAAERAKISLSERLTAPVNVPFVTLVDDKPCDIDTTLTRAELEKLTAGLIDRTLRVCDDVLTNCGLKISDMGELLLVGGQSRMPLVREKIRAFFGREASRAVHPDEAVALGAALLADSIQSGEIGGIVLVDVLPMSIGVGLPGGRFKKVVERNTSLPHKKTYSIWTSEDGQKTLEIPIFQGEGERAQENEYLGTLLVPDLPPGTKGNVVFDIIFSISAESILTVTAEERGTARTVTATFSTQDTPDAVRRRLSGEAGEEPPRLDEDDKGKRPGWVKRLFGT